MNDDSPPHRQVYKITYLLSRIHEIEPLLIHYQFQQISLLQKKSKRSSSQIYQEHEVDCFQAMGQYA